MEKPARGRLQSFSVPSGTEVRNVAFVLPEVRRFPFDCRTSIVLVHFAPVSTESGASFCGPGHPKRLGLFYEKPGRAVSRKPGFPPSGPVAATYGAYSRGLRLTDRTVSHCSMQLV